MTAGLRDHFITAQAALVRGLAPVGHDLTDDLPSSDALEFIDELRDLLEALERRVSLVTTPLRPLASRVNREEQHERN